MQRRNFLQLLGLGGLSLAAHIPVFGQQGRESTIWTPEQKAHLSGGHLVYVRKSGRRVLNFHEDSRVAVSVVLGEGEDPSLAFYHAARNIQEDFRQKAIREFAAMSEWERKGKQIVTFVDNPIFVGTLPDPAQYGFTVEVDYEQRLAYPGELNPRGFELYSETGECPIEIPTGIDFDRVLDMMPTKSELVRIGRGSGMTLRLG
jgi:hypothetical protein